jgi:AcrR family transcriptional regulator
MDTKKYHHGDLKNTLIQAGVEILSEEGVGGLSLRKVAQRAGVSHNAPYFHFADKQALIAAISTEGYRGLYEQLVIIRETYQADPRRQLVEAAFMYLRFAQTRPAHFKVTFSNAVEREEAYPDLVEMADNLIGELIKIVEDCQKAGVLHPAPVGAMAVSVWSAVHGFTSLYIDGQSMHERLKVAPVDQLLIFTLNQFNVADWSADQFPLPG